MNIIFEQYSDEVYYDSLNSTSETDSLGDFILNFEEKYQSDKIKLDITLGLGIKFLDVIHI